MLVEEGDHLKARFLAVFFPEWAVFGATSLVISPGAMEQQRNQPKREQVWPKCMKSRQHGPGQVHQDLACVVEFSADPPPSRNEQSAPHGFGCFAPDGFGWILFELVLL